MGQKEGREKKAEQQKERKTEEGQRKVWTGVKRKQDNNIKTKGNQGRNERKRHEGK